MLQSIRNFLSHSVHMRLMIHTECLCHQPFPVPSSTETLVVVSMTSMQLCLHTTDTIISHKLSKYNTSKVLNCNVAFHQCYKNYC